MKPELPLSQMTKAEKIEVMEALWTDLSRDPETYDSPAWHQSIVEERLDAFRAGKEVPIEWEQAKKEFRQLGS